MALQSGEVVGQYQIVSQLGQGGMATVYKAYHPQLERYVAIKFLQQSYADDANFRNRFEREAKIVASLDHPNIVPIYDFNDHQGQPYLVMKFIEGVTLKEVMAEGDLSKTQMLDLFAAVASGLTYAHERHVLHRDIKPSNILVDRDNRPYITDFGLARIIQTTQSTLSQDMLMGTPYYMSPEQAKGTDELTPATDIYSLGVILYEFAVGQVPFSGNTPYAIVHDHIYTPLPRPCDLHPGVSPEVEAVLIRALAKNPADRYTSAVDMVSAFNKAISADSTKPPPAVPTLPDRTVASATPIPSYTVGAPPTTPVEPAPPNRRNRWLIGSGILALLLVVVLGAVILMKPAPTTIEAQLPTSVSLNITLTVLPTSAAAQATAADLTINQAQTAVAANPQDASTYIALAKAAWQQNETDIAQKSLQDGLKTATDKINYLLTAASVAQSVNRLNALIVLDLQALIRAQSQPPAIYQSIRAQIGKDLYTVAQTPQLINLRDINRLNGAIPDFQPPDLFDIMSVQLLVVEKRLPLAQAAYNRLSDATAKLPEAYLVHGELLQAQGNIDRAKKEWKAALQIADTPQWVTDRVKQLLNST